MLLISPRRLRTLKHSLLELVLITAGLLIALGVDTLVEWHQHQQLAAEAREALDAEIRRNRANLERSLTLLQQDFEQGKGDLLRFQPFLKEGPARDVKGFNFKLGTDRLSQTDVSWQTARATGALAYMGYGEVQRYSAVYAGQQQLLEIEAALDGDVFEFLGNMQRLSYPGDNGETMITPEKAREMAGYVGSSLSRLLRLRVTALALLQLQQNALEDRDTEVRVNLTIDTSGKK